MDQEFLKRPWPTLGFARFLGMFPCKRIWNEDGRSMELKPMNWKVQWALYAGLWLFMGSGFFLVILILSKTEKSTDEIKQCFTELNGNGSIVDILTTSISAALMILGSPVWQLQDERSIM